MVAKTHSISLFGLDCRTVEVQADISNGLPSFVIVGLGDVAVQESKERVRSSIKNSGLIFPPTRKTINLAPVAVKKQGAIFDLPIAISLLLASQQVEADLLKKSILVGELSLTGKVQKVNGIISIVQHAKESGFSKVFLPADNAVEASYIEGIEVYPVQSLSQLVAFLAGEIKIIPQKHTPIPQITSPQTLDFQHIIEHQQAKRGLVIAAAGGHNVLLSGSPGCGKTLLARSFQGILPAMEQDEIMEITKIYSSAGVLQDQEPLVTDRPFQEVHHTASAISLIGGGGKNPNIGKISLAHNGVLFLDEISEFSRSSIESLRQPLEDGYININRSHFSVKLPCQFNLIATTNPCPCGYRGDNRVKCVCSDQQVSNYQKKLSGPLLDRFDIFLQIEKVRMGKMFDKRYQAQTHELSSKISQAVQIQNERFRRRPHIRRNGDMGIKEIKQFCQLNHVAKVLLEKATKSLDLSNRAYTKILKIARTIADLEQSENIKTAHVSEALQYRKENPTP